MHTVFIILWSLFAAIGIIYTLCMVIWLILRKLGIITYTSRTIPPPHKEE